LQGVWVMTLLPPINTEVGFMDLEVTKIAEKMAIHFYEALQVYLFAFNSWQT